MKPKYDLDKIKFATDAPTFMRAVQLYELGKVHDFKFDANIGGYTAKVQGTEIYNIYIDQRYYDQGDCDCYLGQHDKLCKHIVAVAIYAVKNGFKLSDDEKALVPSPHCSDRLGELTSAQLAEVKQSITSAMKYIKPYNGPSRIWFAYQNSLDEGCARLSKLVSDLPVSEQTSKLLVSLLLRLDKKLCTGGVDDSNGTVGGFIQEVVFMLQEYAKLDTRCIKIFKKLCNQETCFGWEEPLVELFEKK